MSDETCIGSKAMSVISVVMCGSLSPRFQIATFTELTRLIF